MSHMTSLQKALKAAAKVRVLVKIATVTAKKAQAPVGSGSSTSPAMTLLTSGLLLDWSAMIHVQAAWLVLHVPGLASEQCESAVRHCTSADAICCCKSVSMMHKCAQPSFVRRESAHL